jgi:hypothetical protein
LVHEETCAISADSFTSEKTKEKAITVPLDTPTVRGDVARCCHPYWGFCSSGHIQWRGSCHVSQVTVDPIFLITIEDAPMHSTVEVINPRAPRSKWRIHR